MYSSKYIVITSINSLTKAVIDFSAMPDWHVIVVGDRKSIIYEHDNVTYLDVDKQLGMGYKSTETTPYNHYSRKNIGYLHAISNGAKAVYDTDDDTIPYSDWYARPFSCSVVVGGCKNINPYKLYTDKKVWPRGLDLSVVNDNQEYTIESGKCNVGVWQGVIDGDSDFDAIYRLTNNEHIIYTNKLSIAIDKHCYAPFNTQSTLWNSDFFPLLYIPISVNFRFTDILRGYVAQRILWEYNHYLGYHYPNTYQIRNMHNFFYDFVDELSMYTNTPTVIKLLDTVSLTGTSLAEDLCRVYNCLYENKIVQEYEIANLTNWLKDLK